MKNLIGNEWKTSKMGIVKVINPYNGDLIDTVPASSKEDILDAVDKAKKITKLWEEIGLFKRVAIIKDFIKLVSINKKRLSLRLSEETGKKYKDALFEINNLILISKTVVSEIFKLEEEVRPISDREMTFSRRVPQGIIAIFLSSTEAITDFARYVLPALTAGNAVIIKPSSSAPLTIIELAYLLNKAGAYSGSVSVINGPGELSGDILSSSPNIGLIYFAGSTYAGVKVMTRASNNLTPVVASLSSSNAVIIDETARLDLAVKDLVASKTFNNGQSAMSPKRIYVAHQIYEEFKSLLTSALSKLKVGAPLEDVDISPLITKEAADKIYAELVNSKVIYGGNIKGAIIYPTIIEVDFTSPYLSYKELNGPVLTLCPYRDIEEAITSLNNSPYGMSASLYTEKDATPYFEKIDTGSIIINGLLFDRDYKIARDSFKYSGNAPFDIKNILKTFTKTKVLCIKTGNERK